MNFLALKSKFFAQLAKASVKQGFKKKLLEILSQIDSNEKSNFNNEETQSTFRQNKDDFHGINSS